MAPFTYIKFIMKLNSIQTKIESIVGNNTESTVHFILLVSFFMVIIVVAHGQWKSEKRITEIAVLAVQPFAISSSRNDESEPVSTSLPVFIYPIIIMGNTISLAGEPRIKASKITKTKAEKAM